MPPEPAELLPFFLVFIGSFLIFNCVVAGLKCSAGFLFLGDGFIMIGFWIWNIIWNVKEKGSKSELKFEEQDKSFDADW